MKRTTYKRARFQFWDIESLANVFTIALFDRENSRSRRVLSR